MDDTVLCLTYVEQHLNQMIEGDFYVNKNELISAVAQETGVIKKDVATAVEAT